MRRIIVINMKGGCGKTTIATNLASFYAGRGFGTALYDYDPQGSSMNWLRQRPHTQPPVHGVAAHQAQSSVTRSFALRIPAHINRVIVDTPAGLKGHRLGEQLKDRDVVIIPVVPSAIDLHSTADFMRDMLLVVKARARRMRLAIIANRLRNASPAMTSFEEFVDGLKVPVIARLSDTTSYLVAAERGLGVHELPQPDRPDASDDQQSWRTVLEWIESEPTTAVPTPAPAMSGHEI
jgi:chromosome partitioning protein